MKRVLCILSGMNAGGAETFLMKMYRSIDKTQYQMDFCINENNKCFYEDEIVEMGGRIFRIPSKSENLKEFRKQLMALVKNEKYQYVLRITSNAMGFMDLKIAKKAGAEVCIARSSNSSDGSGWKIRLAHLLGKMLYGRYVDVKIAPSDLAAEYTFGKGGMKKEKVHILHNGVDLNVFHYDDEARYSIRRAMGISEDRLVIGHIGRFSAQKNHVFLIDVFRRIREKNRNAILLLVGEGELQEQIKERVEELGLTNVVIFAGIRKDIPQIFSAMDVFVFPSFYEGMPNTVIEAQATGLPCVVADTVTRQANITGLIEYLSLEDSTELWSEKAIQSVAYERQNTKDDFVKQGYDSNTVMREFVKLVFGE